MLYFPNCMWVKYWEFTSQSCPFRPQLVGVDRWATSQEATTIQQTLLYLALTKIKLYQFITLVFDLISKIDVFLLILRFAILKFQLCRRKELHMVYANDMYKNGCKNSLFIITRYYGVRAQAEMMIAFIYGDYKTKKCLSEQTYSLGSYRPGYNRL